MAALGVGCGCLVHVFGAAIGLSAVLAASATAFLIVKLIGAVYLCYMGVRMLFTRLSTTAKIAADVRPVTLRQVFWQGAMTDALNPKVALFFVAFLPQFVDPAATHKGLAFLLLGMIFVVNGTIWCLGLAAFAAKAAHRIRQSGQMLLWINRTLGALFVYLGVRVALLDAR
jgi:threonine/homoserine/homoserine lactone efflux protein